tara:strand:- start:197 stop:454 length:258 start_codon:yes stop_codon:yes gene_type:complete
MFLVFINKIDDADNSAVIKNGVCIALPKANLHPNSKSPNDISSSLPKIEYIVRASRESVIIPIKSRKDTILTINNPICIPVQIWR